LPKIEFDKPTRERLSRQLASHLKNELDADVGPFEALDLLDLLSKTLGPYYYNQGLQDAQAIVRARIESIIEAVEAIEQPIKT
jgi:uncharacterized protein (DUF2164 family)